MGWGCQRALESGAEIISRNTGSLEAKLKYDVSPSGQAGREAESTTDDSTEQT